MLTDEDGVGLGRRISSNTVGDLEVGIAKEKKIRTTRIFKETDILEKSERSCCSGSTCSSVVNGSGTGSGASVGSSGVRGIDGAAGAGALGTDGNRSGRHKAREEGDEDSEGSDLNHFGKYEFTKKGVR